MIVSVESRLGWNMCTAERGGRAVWCFENLRR